MKACKRGCALILRGRGSDMERKVGFEAIAQ